MKNNKIDTLIDKYLIESITPDEERELTALLNENQANMAYFHQCANIWISAQPTFDFDKINVSKAKNDILKMIRVKKEPKHMFFIWAQRIAAILILPLCVYLYYLVNEQNTSSENIAYTEVISPIGATLKVHLSDGSIVWLNSGSKLKCPHNFVAGKRDVILIGEAYFEVYSDKKNPFIVETKGLNVTATGTKFNVEAFLQDSLAAVTLIEGKVKVDIKELNKSVKLLPNKQLVFNKEKNTVGVSDIENNKYGAWKDGGLVFDDDRLDNILKKIGFLYNLDFEITHPEMASQHYKATFKNKSLDDILELLKLTTPLHYKKIQSNDTIHKTKIIVY